MRPVAAALALSLAVVAACSGDGDEGSAEELCALVGDGRSYAALFEDGFDPTDRDRARAQLRAAAVDLDEVRAAAPASLRDAVDDEARYVDALLEVLDSTDADDPAAIVLGVNALDAERAAADAAALELAAFEAERCGADADLGSAADGT